MAPSKSLLGIKVQEKKIRLSSLTIRTIRARKTMKIWSKKLRSTKLEEEKQWDKTLSNNSLKLLAINIKA